MIVFDLEWTQPFGQESMEEIIQIGAVKIDKLGGPDHGQLYRIHKAIRLSGVVPDCEAPA